RETSADPDQWSPEAPAWGQCAVTALVVQELLGGDLLRAHVEGISHYWNRLPDGRDLDFTREQFEDGVHIPPGASRSRDYVLSFEETLRRYIALQRQVMSR